MVSTPIAHLICLGLVAGDLIVRAWRIQWYVRGLGHPVSFWDAFVANAFGEAACAVTPLRLGGEPARLAGLLRTRVPAPAALVAISVEILAAWPIVVGFGIWLGWRYAPEWWALAGPALTRSARRSVEWMVVIGLLTLAAWILVRRRFPRHQSRLRRSARRVMVYWRRTPSWSVLASFPCTAINVVARVAVLPVLVLTMPDHPPLGPVLLGSFALLYSQLILPTPSGVGAVELGFLAGAAGDLGDDAGRLLLAWRFYTSGVGVLLGAALAVRYYGWEKVRRMLRPEPRFPSPPL
ncbi:MAG: lysylphosphatidylglycerol synthase transmembrane domain-containing protein [Gemmatimonadota bacterium]